MPLDVVPFGHYQATPAQAALMAVGRRLPDTWIGRRIGSLIRSYLSRTRRDPVDVTVLGQRMRLHCGDNACEKRLAVTPQFFDPNELAFIRSRLKPGFVFVDIGANVGTYSVFSALNAGPSARVLAIDPNAIVLKRLAFNADANGLANVRMLNIALGDQAGELEFAVDTQNMGGSSLQMNRKARAAKTIIRVPVRPLLSVAESEGLTAIDVLKIDVEGFEDRILLPFFAAAPKSLWPLAIIMEQAGIGWQTDCLAALGEIGYSRVEDRGGNCILTRPPEAGVQ